jgi:hypothetical protein
MKNTIGKPLKVEGSGFSLGSETQLTSQMEPSRQVGQFSMLQFLQSSIGKVFPLGVHSQSQVIFYKNKIIFNYLI